VSFAAITLRVASQRVFIVIDYRLSPETFGYTLVYPSTRVYHSPSPYLFSLNLLLDVTTWCMIILSSW